MQEDKTMHNHSATESNIKMTVSAVCENWLGTVSTAQKRCKEEKRLLHLVLLYPRAEAGALPCAGTQLSALLSNYSWSGGRAGPRGRNSGGGRWKKAHPVPQNSSQSLIWYLASSPHPLQNQLLPILLMLATRKIPFPSFSCCFTPRSLLQNGMQIYSAQRYSR